MARTIDLTNAVGIEDIRAARERLRGSVLRTPLVRLAVDDAQTEIYLKLENLQPTGAFKLRSAGNALAMASQEQLEHGVFTPSAGNMAQGVAWNARRLGIPCIAIVPDHAPETKLAAITRLGARIEKVPFDRWWRIMAGEEQPDIEGLFVHPCSDPAVIAGNGTIGLEIVEDLPDVDAILTPFGGGGLSVGVATAIRALKPDTRVFACEVETAAPLAASLAVGEPVPVPYTATFVDGIGGKTVFPEMWPLLTQLLDGSLVVSLPEVIGAIRTLVERNRVVAEGAGAAPVAAALAGVSGARKIACVVSGGNIDTKKLGRILLGEEP